MGVGNPLDLTTQIGAVNSERQLQGNLPVVTDAVAEGDEVITSGQHALETTVGW